MPLPTIDPLTQGILDRIVLKLMEFPTAKFAGGNVVCRVCKADEDRQIVMGWASVCSIGGEEVIDKQGDIIPEDELENAVYDYNLYCRKQGDMHERLGVGRLVQSMVFTKELSDLGFTAVDPLTGEQIIGWFVGFKVDDPGVWKRIKAGELPEFSIGGKAIRDDVA